MSDKIIIGLAGQKHTGKTTTANAIKKFLDDKYSHPFIPTASKVLKYSFAFYLKDLDKKMFKIANPNATDEELNEKRRGNLCETGDLLKKLYGKDIFCKMLLNDMKRSEANILIVDDVRYSYEAEALLSLKSEGYDVKIFPLIKHISSVSNYVDFICKDMSNNPGKYSDMHSSESGFFDLIDRYDTINLFKGDYEKEYKPKLQIAIEILCHYDKFKNLI